MKTAKKVILVLSLIVVSSFALSFAQPLKAQTAIDALIASLQRQIAALQTQLYNLQHPTQPVAWCYTFSNNLRVGDSGMGVVNLQMALSREGLYGNSQTGMFNEQLASAVVAFQEKYASEILTPNGLAHGTGYVGPSTRAKLNSLYGCNVPPFNSLVINNVSGPTVLNVGQTGTWTVSATDSDNDVLSYSVNWGDSTPVPAPMDLRAGAAAQQTATFTHSYSVAGFYTIIFRVADTDGNVATRAVSVSVGQQTSNGRPVISGVSGPSVLNINQTGTWTITATDPNNDTLSYSVTWGDENQGLVASQDIRINATSQTVTLAHSYARIGNYNVIFRVTDSSGNVATATISVQVSNNVY